MTLREVPHQTVSVPDTSAMPRRPRRVAVISAVVGLALAVFWSFELVDSGIGANVADTVLGHDARATSITGTAAALLFAFVSGFAGTFTACNIAIAATLGPMTQAGHGHGVLRAMLRPLGWLTLGMVAVSAVYGAVGVLLGDRLPQLSAATVGGVPVRLVQASVVFGVLGLVFTYLGLAALGLVKDPFAGRPVARVVTMGALVGGFLIGRPYPLFNKLFHWAVDSGNPLYGALTFTLQSIGNVLLVAVIFAAILLVTRGRFPGWLARGSRAATLTGSSMVAFGIFMVVYWDVRLPARFDIGWFPMMPYN